MIAAMRREGRRPPAWCSFGCPLADTSRSQHAACLAVNGVWCRALETPVEKGSPCRWRHGDFGS